MSRAAEGMPKALQAEAALGDPCRCCRRAGIQSPCSFHRFLGTGWISSRSVAYVDFALPYALSFATSGTLLHRQWTQLAAGSGEEVGRLVLGHERAGVLSQRKN